jgi:PGF-pre-PGF domain-containing protein
MKENKMKKITIFTIIILSLLIISCSGMVSDIASFNGTVHSDNLSSYNFSYQKNGDSTWNYNGFNISNNQNNINFSLMGDWDTSVVNDGEYIIKLNVTDNFSQSSYDYVYISVENLKIISPVNNSIQILNSTFEIIGIAKGKSYQNYTITYTNDTKPYIWTTLGINLTDNGYPNKTNATLAIINTSYITQNTIYYFNITNINDNGFTNTKIINITFIGIDNYEPDDVFSQANEITTGGTHQVHSFMPENDIDFINFSAIEDTKYDIETHSSDNGLSFESDTVVYLFDSDGTTYLYSNDDGGEGYLSKFSFTSLTNQTYYIGIENYHGYSGGTYEISIHNYSKYYKGIIPTTYSFPFYTSNNNPVNCSNVNFGDYCNMSWTVYSSTYIDSEYDFFTIIEDDYNLNDSAITRIKTVEFSKPNISISSPTNNSAITSGSIDLTITTDVDTSCRYSTSQYFYNWYSGWAFSSTGGTTHTKTISTNYDTTYNYYYICKREQNGVYSYSDIIYHKFSTNSAPECTVEGDCSGDDVCDSNVCVECANDNDCGGDDVCNSNVCVECVNDNDCSGDDICDSNQCVECASDSDCDSDEECNSNVCEAEDDDGGDSSPSSSPPSDSPSTTNTNDDLSTSTTIKASVFDIKKNERTKIEVKSENIAITSIKIEVNKDIEGISRFKFETLSEKPERISKKPSKNIYQYINIENENIDSQNIDEVKFEFMVEKIWLLENNISQGDIILLRYLEDSEEWQALSTKLIDSGAALITYEATSTGFSTFAVGIKQGPEDEEIIITNQTLNDTISNVSNENNSDANVNGTNKVVDSSTIPFNDENNESGSGLPWTFMIIILIIVVIASFGFYSLKNIDKYKEKINEIKSKFEKDPSKLEISPTEQIINDTTNNLDGNNLSKDINTNINPNDNLNLNTNLNTNNNLNLDTGLDLNENINLELTQTNNSQNQQNDFHELINSMLNNARMFGPENMKKNLPSKFSKQNVEKGVDTINNLFEYIKNQKVKGYDINKIKEVLISQGWEQKIIEEIVEFIK